MTEILVMALIVTTVLLFVAVGRNNLNKRLNYELRRRRELINKILSDKK